MDLLWLQGDCARPAGCAFPNALAGRALAQDSSLFRKRKENCFFAPFLTSKLDGRGRHATRGISSLCSDIPYALAGRALAQDSSLFRKRKENCFFARLQPGDCARPAGCAFPNALAGRALAQDSSLFRKRKENCFFAPLLTSGA